MIDNNLSHSNIKNRESTPYHPQANGQVEVTNRALESILENLVSNSRKDWVDKLVEATSAYNTTWKTTTSFNPYDLVYGKKAPLSIEYGKFQSEKEVQRERAGIRGRFMAFNLINSRRTLAAII